MNQRATTGATFEGATADVRRARRVAADTAAAHGFDTTDVELLTSELASNAVLHTQGPFGVEVSVDGDIVRVAVHDGDPTPPTMRDGAATAVTGRGMRIVERVATRWGVDVEQEGKTVWFEVRPGRAM